MKIIFTTQFADRSLAIYSLLLIIIGTPLNLLCMCIYFQKNNRSNSIKLIFGYLALIDTFVLYTFNLNYVIREFHLHVRIDSNEFRNQTVVRYVKKNLEEYSLIICRFLSYFGEILTKIFIEKRILRLAFSTLQTASWILVFGSLNRYFLIKKIAHFQFIRQRRFTMPLCICLSLFFYLINLHILILNGFYSPLTGHVICYSNFYYPMYMIWYQRVHLCIYSVIPSFILLILNSSLIKTVFASKKRLKNHQRTSSMSEHSQRDSTLNRLSTLSSRKSRRNYAHRSMTRPNRKLTLSLVFLTFSYFILTFPSTVIFSFFRPHIEPIQLRRTLSLLFTNLSTTTHAIRFLIYFFCSTDFRQDFSQLFSFGRRYSPLSLRKKNPSDQITRTTNLSVIRKENQTTTILD